jgi:hypothetical protein
MEAGSFLRETIDTSLSDLLGEQAKSATLFHLNLPDYEKRPKEFHVQLGGIFKLGTPVIEKMIVRDVYKRLNLRFDEQAAFDYEKSMKLAYKVSCEKYPPGKEERGVHGKS